MKERDDIMKFLKLIISKLKEIDKSCSSWFLEYDSEDFSEPKEKINSLIKFIEEKPTK